jgi:hypothetical protein
MVSQKENSFYPPFILVYNHSLSTRRGRGEKKTISWMRR